MKALLEFEFPEDQLGFSDAINGAKFKFVLGEMDEWLRRQIKYEGREEFQEIRDKLTELLLEQNVGIHE